MLKIEQQEKLHPPTDVSVSLQCHPQLLSGRFENLVHNILTNENSTLEINVSHFRVLHWQQWQPPASGPREPWVLLKYLCKKDKNLAGKQMSQIKIWIFLGFLFLKITVLQYFSGIFYWQMSHKCSISAIFLNKTKRFYRKPTCHKTNEMDYIIFIKHWNVINLSFYIHINADHETTKEQE